MRAIKVDIDGTVGDYEGPEDFWMDDDIVWAEGPYPGDPQHAVYYDDDALFADEQVRATLGGLDYPLPFWIVGVSGDETVDVALALEKVIGDLGPRRDPLSDDGAATYATGNV